MDIRIRKMVHKERREGRDEPKGTYINIDGVISAKWERNDFLRSEPDIVGFVETKLGDGMELLDPGEGIYNVWKINRKEEHEGGVVMLFKKGNND